MWCLQVRFFEIVRMHKIQMYEQNQILYEENRPLAGLKSFKLNDFDVKSKTFLNNVLSFFRLDLCFSVILLLFLNIMRVQ